MEIKIVELDTFETRSRRMFPSSVAEQAIENAKDLSFPLYPYGSVRSLEFVVGTVKNLRIEDGYLVGDVKFLDPKKALYEYGVNLSVTYGIEAINEVTEQGFEIIVEAKFSFFYVDIDHRIKNNKYLSRQNRTNNESE